MTTYYPTREAAREAVPHYRSRTARLRPFTVNGPDYNRRVAEELAAATWGWDPADIGARLVTAEIAAGLRPETDYPIRFEDTTWKVTP